MISACFLSIQVCGGSMSPCVYHLGSFSQILSLPVPDGVVTQTAIFAKDRVSSRTSSHCTCAKG